MKKIISYLLAATVALSSLVSVSAANNNVEVYLNGNKIEFDVQPQIINDRTMVPMRAIFEAMNCEVVWHQNLEQIVVWQNDELLMNLEVGRNYMDLFDAGTKELDVPPMIINERTLVPLRAISESIGATVSWNGKTKTVTITYTQQAAVSDDTFEYENDDDYDYYDDSDDYDYDYDYDDDDEYYDDDDECAHKKTSEVLAIDLRKYEDIGSSSKHKVIDTVEIVCDECSEFVDTIKKENNKAHNLKNGVCEYCGYELEVEEKHEPTDTTTSTYTPVSSTEISDYVNGAFMYITVPAGKSIEIPNTSEGGLSLKAEGISNIMECKADGSYDILPYNNKDTKRTKSILKKSSAIIQNSGDSDLIVSIPKEYAVYQETDEKVYEILTVNEGENVQIEPTRENRGCKIYLSGRKSERVLYNPKNIVHATMQASDTYLTLNKSEVELIRANENMEFYYCPFTASCVKTSTSPFNELTVESRDTVRISATKDSRSFVYTDGESDYDYVIYTNDGRVSSQKQGVSNDYIAIGKDRYIDFTNVSENEVTIRIPCVYTSVE